MAVWLDPHPFAGLAFGAAVTVAALFIALPKTVTWRSGIPFLRDQEVPWRGVVAVAGVLALAGLWHPVLASVLLALGILLFAAAMDLTSLDLDLGDTERRIERLAPVHGPGTDES